MAGLYIGNSPIYAPYVGDVMAHSVYLGDTMVWKRDPESGTLTASATVTLYPYYRYLDLVGVGGGASGQTGSGATNTAGKGGDAGYWLGQTLVRGVDFPEDATSLVVSVGAATGRAADSDLAASINGNPTTFTIAGVVVATAAGGVGNPSSAKAGEGPYDFTFRGVTYTGGTNSSENAAGNAPGGGGSGGSGGIFGSRTRGREGARGQAWHVQRNI